MQPSMMMNWTPEGPQRVSRLTKGFQRSFTKLQTQSLGPQSEQEWHISTPLHLSAGCCLPARDGKRSWHSSRLPCSQSHVMTWGAVHHHRNLGRRQKAEGPAVAVVAMFLKCSLGSLLIDRPGTLPTTKRFWETAAHSQEPDPPQRGIRPHVTVDMRAFEGSAYRCSCLSGIEYQV